MIDSLISFLQSLKGGVFQRVIKSIVLILCLLVALILFLGGIRSLGRIFDYHTIKRFYIGLSLLCIYIAVLIWIASMRVGRSGKSISTYFYLTIVPLVSLGLVYLFSEFFGFNLYFIGDIVENLGEIISIILYLITAMYSLISLHKIVYNTGENSRFGAKLQSFFGTYAIGFFFFVALLMTLGLLGGDWKDLLNTGFWGALLFFFLFAFSYSYPFVIMRLYIKQYGRMKLVWGIVLMVVVFIFSYISGLMGDWHGRQIDKAHEIIRVDGENEKAYTKAQGKLFLAKAFLKKYKERNRLSTQENTLFQKLYDATPEDFFGKKLADHTTIGRSSNATNSTQVGDEANVVLKLAEIENNITEEEIPLSETTYTFHFTNETTTNQEVVVFFEAPSMYSVVSDLKLGLNLELQGQIASRGAAKKVYNDSLRVNKDPALIEKVGMSTYSLRVFPIPSKTDNKTQGRQKVEVTLLSPLDDNKIIYSPKFSFINLKTNNDSSIIAKAYNDNILVEEDIKKGDDVLPYLSSEHEMKNKLKLENDTSFRDQCVSEDMTGLLTAENTLKLQGFLSAHHGNDTKISLFLDNSRSVERSRAYKLYNAVYNEMKHFDDTLHDIDIYAYNFMVEKVAQVDDIKYRGYSDVDSVVSYIEDNDIENETIILLTDDESFTMNTVENKKRNFLSLMTNKFVVIKVGNQVKRYKSDFTNLIAATEGNIYEIQDEKDIVGVLGKILESDEEYLSLCGQQKKEAVLNVKKMAAKKSQKLIAGYFGNALFGLVENEGDWKTLANIQNKLAHKYTIVNQFNSMIALENERQQRDLERYEQQNDKYDSDFNNYGKDSGDQRIEGGLRFANDIGNEISDISSQRGASSGSPFSNSNPYRDIANGGSTDSLNVIGAGSSSRRGGSRFGRSSPSAAYSGGSRGDINASGWTILFIALIYCVYIYQLILFFISLVKGKVLHKEKNETSYTASILEEQFKETGEV